MKIIEHFGNISGLRLNDKKTETFWVGARVNWDFKLCPEKILNDRKKKLGVWLSTDPDVTIPLNYKEKVEKIS